ncbi:MAG: DUF2237 domain-containing protein [Eudoraea sp.]|nr:DUF2237 domain-containing protein [Eudoraea sp.]NNJ40418.1 DUF2237 domain-containing protein [Eudoraea sp.]
MNRNVLGNKLQPCCLDPLTGYFRDGYCRTMAMDTGTHVVCAVVTEEFLQFSRQKGNDLITPIPQWQFPGLKPGDRWCLCISRWLEAERAGVAPAVVLEATNSKALEFTSIELLRKYEYLNNLNGA